MESTKMEFTRDSPSMPPTINKEEKKNRARKATIGELFKAILSGISYQPSTVKILKMEYNDINGLPKYSGEICLNRKHVNIDNTNIKIKKLNNTKTEDFIARLTPLIKCSIPGINRMNLKNLNTLLSLNTRKNPKFKSCKEVKAINKEGIESITKNISNRFQPDFTYSFQPKCFNSIMSSKQNIKVNT